MNAKIASMEIMGNGKIMELALLAVVILGFMGKSKMKECYRMDSINTRIENIRKGITKRAATMKAKAQKQGFQFKPFSTKQKKVLTWWCPASPVKDMNGIIADGAIRSGKTLSMSLSYVLWAMESFNQQNFGMAGKTIGSFRRNVLFWLKLMLASRKYTVIDKRSDNLLIVSKGNTVNYFYIFGGKDERSQDLIQGRVMPPQ